VSKKIITFDGVTRLDIPASRVLEQALEAEIETAVIVGWDKDGEFYFASSVAGGADVVWLMEKAKKRLLEIEE